MYLLLLHKNTTLVYFRITPFLPNWFINIVSPVIGVDLRPFWLGTFVGVAPPSFIAIQVSRTMNGFGRGKRVTLYRWSDTRFR